MTRLFCLLVFAARIYAADCYLFFGTGGGSPLTTAAQTVQFNNQSSGCFDWRLTYTSQGFSALSLIVESAPDVSGSPGTFVTFTTPEVTNPILGINPNTNTTGASTLLRGSPAWIRVRLASVTGTGSISGILFGCGEPGCGGEAATSIVQPISVTQSGTWTVQPGNTQNSTPWLVTEGLNTTGGATPFLANALTTTVTTVKGSAGVLYGYYCLNPAAANTYIQIFDISGTVTLGTSVPKLSLGIPASANGPGGANLSIFGGVNFVNAIKVAATTTATGSTAPGTAADCNFWFK